MSALELVVFNGFVAHVARRLDAVTVALLPHVAAQRRPDARAVADGRVAHR